MRAISVKVNEVIGVAGFVVPGTRVDVMVTLHEPAAERRQPDARRRQQRAGADGRHALRPGKGQGRPPIPSTVVTLLVTPEDAERIALAASEGQVMLTLRNPLDTTPTQTTGVRTAGLFGQPAPAPVVKSPGRSAATPVQPVLAPARSSRPAPQLYIVEAIQGRQANRRDSSMKYHP